MISFHLSSQVEEFVLNNPAYTRWRCSVEKLIEIDKINKYYNLYNLEIKFH